MGTLMKPPRPSQNLQNEMYFVVLDALKAVNKRLDTSPLIRAVDYDCALSFWHLCHL